MLQHERELQERGFERIAGVDEAGRGALAGPMVAAAVILPPEFFPGRITDSKDMSPGQREFEFARVIAEAVAISTAWMTVTTLDEAVRTDMFDEAHRDLLRGAINALYPRPDFVLIDSYEIPDLGIESRFFPHADAESITVAAASVVAKVTRDKAMEDLDHLFPEWGFARHKGYGGGSGEHAAALEAHGISPVHRLSYVAKPASKVLVQAAQGPRQGNWAQDDLAEAGYVWSNLHPNARRLFEILLESSQPVGWRDLASALGPLARQDTVVGTFGPPAGLAKRVGRTRLVYSEGTPAGPVFWLDPFVKVLFQRMRSDPGSQSSHLPNSTRNAPEARRHPISEAEAFEENKRRVLAGEIRSHKKSDWKRRFRRK
jgi:ribonuclease HII